MEKSTLKTMPFGKEKLKNVWYFYKKQIILCLILLVVGVFLLIQCVSRKSYELNIYVASDRYLTSEAQKSLGEAFEAVIKKEHAHSVGFITTVIGDKITVSGTEEENKQYAMDYTGQKQTMADFKARMRLPDTVICLLSPACFEQAVTDEGTLRPLREILSPLPDGTTENGYGVRVSLLPFYKSNSILKALPEDTVICVKASSIFRSGDDYSRQIEAFCDIVNYRPAASPGDDPTEAETANEPTTVKTAEGSGTDASNSDIPSADPTDSTVEEPAETTEIPKEIHMRALSLHFNKNDLISTEFDPKTGKRGAKTEYALWYATDYIDVSDARAIYYRLAVHKYLCSAAFFDQDKRFLGGISSATVSRAACEQGYAALPEGTRYARFCNFISGDYAFSDAFVNLICSKEDEDAFLAANPRSSYRIAMIGDSLTEGDQGTDTPGVGHMNYRNYPFYLAEALGCTTVNYGKCGYTVRDILSCYPREIDISNADLILVMLGTNAGIGDEDQQKAYKALIKRIEKEKKEDAQIVLVTPPHATEIRGKVNYGYNPNVISAAEYARSFARKNGYRLIDAYRDSPVQEANESVYQPNDGLHMSSDGYKAFAEFIAAQLIEQGIVK